MRFEIDELFGQSEDDLIFRNVTGVDKLFVKGKIQSWTVKIGPVSKF